MADLNEPAEPEAQEPPLDGEQLPPEDNPPPDPEVEAEAKPEGEEPPEEAKSEQTPEDKAATEEKKRSRPGGWQRRIARAERERDEAYDLLRRQQAGVQGPGQTPPGKEQTPEDKAAAYIQMQVQQGIERAREQDRIAEAHRSQVQAAAEFQRGAEEVRGRYADFDDVMEEAHDAPVAPYVQQALLTSKLGPEIMYQLAKNPAELARLNALPPLDAAREIGRLEAKASSTPAPKTQQRSAARPPVPPTSVGGSASSSRNLEDLPIQEYKRLMRSKGR